MGATDPADDHSTAYRPSGSVRVTKPAPPLQSFSRWVEPELASLVHHALEQDPLRRPQEVREYAHAIHVLAPRGIAVTPEMLTPLTEEERAHVARRMA